MFSRKVNPLFNGTEILSSVSGKAKLFAKNFSKNSNLDDLGTRFSSRTNPKLYNIYVTPKMVKNVITNLDSSKVSSPDCFKESLVLVLKNCEPELSYIPDKLFNLYPGESRVPDCWKVISVVPVFKNVGESSTAKKYCPVGHFLWLVNFLKNL